MEINKYGRLPRKTLMESLGLLKHSIFNVSYEPSPELGIEGKFVETEETLYIYESKKASSERRVLSLISIKTLVLLHMLTNNGGINDFDPEEAADYLECCTLSIKNSLDQLVEKNFILCQKSEYTGLYTILIRDYSKNIKTTASENGAGYVTINEAFLKALCSCKTITSARLLLRTYYFTNHSKKRASGIILYFKQFLKGFPDYVTKSMLKAALKELNQFISYEDKKNRISIHLMNDYNGESAYRSERLAVTNEVQTFINSYNDQIIKFEKALKQISNPKNNKNKNRGEDDIKASSLNLRRIGFMDPDSLIKSNHLHAFTISEKELYDFATIAMKHGVKTFCRAFVKSCEETPDFTNPAGLIRSRAAFLHAFAIDLSNQRQEHAFSDRDLISAYTFA